ncbi:hypothetical protein PG993_004639 [Apiospora rasikravindrae]|uniref:Uncharacterized protein n=1 Tax=Apiospora rasikravindrae TaxID=990691 RepID=A0ABR1TFD4_9PEZI
MSPSSTRRSTRLHRPSTSTNNHADDPYTIARSSEDGDEDDDEFIPANISPHKVFASANGPSLRPPRPFKRHLEDDTLDHTTSSKRLKDNGIASSPLRDRSQPEPQTDTGLASPAPSRALTAPNNRASRSASGESPSDNDVDIALFNLVNSKMIKRNPVEAPRHQANNCCKKKLDKKSRSRKYLNLSTLARKSLSWETLGWKTLNKMNLN